MAFDFPNAPVLNEVYTQHGKTYFWDGVAWRKQPHIVDYVQAAGDTMTGDLAISKIGPVFTLNKSAQGEANRIRGSEAGVMRWEVNIGDTWPETGGNSGSDFEIQRFDDAGTQIDTVFRAKRDTGIVDFEYNPTVQGVPIGVQGNFLPLTGGTVTGPIVLEALAPQNDQDAVPKHWVEALVTVPPPLTWEDVITPPVMSGTNGGPLGGNNHRTRVYAGSFVNDGGAKVRVTFEISASNAGVTLEAWIGYAAPFGDPYDFEAAPVQLLSGGVAAAPVQLGDINNIHPLVFEGDFVVDPAKDLLISTRIGGTPTSQFMRNGTATAACETWFGGGGNPTQVDAPPGYTDFNQIYMLQSVEQEGVGGVPTPIYVPIAGGTMTGPLILDAPPVDPLGAAGRQWVLDQIANTLQSYQMYQGTWSVAANSPDIVAAVKPNGAAWRAITPSGSPEVAPPGIPGVSGETITAGDLIVWSQPQGTFQNFSATGLSQTEADLRYLQLSGAAPMAGNITFARDGDGLNLFGGAKFYKKTGAGIAIRESSGGQQPVIENNDGSNVRDIIDLAATDARYLKLTGGRLSGSLYLDAGGIDILTSGITMRGIFNHGAQYQYGDLIIQGPTNGNGGTYGLTWNDGGGNRLARIDANRTGYNISPEARLQFMASNGGWGWKTHMYTNVSSPAGIHVDGDVSAASFTDR